MFRDFVLLNRSWEHSRVEGGDKELVHVYGEGPSTSARKSARRLYVVLFLHNLAD